MQDRITAVGPWDIYLNPDGNSHGKYPIEAATIAAQIARIPARTQTGIRYTRSSSMALPNRKPIKNTGILGTKIMAEGCRTFENVAQIYGSSTSVPIAVSNGNTIKVSMTCTKNAAVAKPVYLRFLCFGCTVS